MASNIPDERNGGGIRQIDIDLPLAAFGPQSGSPLRAHHAWTGLAERWG
jgi:hypothetical protein